MPAPSNPPIDDDIIDETTETTEIILMEPGGEELADATIQLRILCEHQLGDETDPERKGRLHYELGRLYELDGELARAAEHYRATLQASPRHAAAARGARRVLSKAGKHAAVPPLLDREIELTRDPPGRAQLLYEKGVILEGRLGQRSSALAVYQQAHALDPGSVLILKAIERCHLADKAWPKLVEVYGLLANAVQDAALASAWTALAGHLTEFRLGDPDTATTLYQRALALDPHATEALSNLKRLDVTHARWPGVVRTLRKELALCSDAETQHALLTLIAGIEERHLDDANAAISTLEQALTVRPHDRELLSEVARLHGDRGRHASQANALARLAELSENVEDATALCHRLGRLHEQEMSDPEGGRRWYERALAHDPAHAPAALALGALLESQAAWPALLRMWATQVRAITDAKAQADLHHRMGVLIESKMMRPAEATASHAQALALDPDHHEAFQALTRLLAEDGRWHELAELYQRCIDRAPHDAEAIAWLTRLGAVLEDRLADPVSALTVYERVLALDPTSLGALHAVQRAAERAGRFERLVTALQAEAQLTADASRRGSLLHRAAGVMSGQLGDALGAQRALGELLGQQPKHHAALESLAQLYVAGGNWAELVGVCTKLLPLASEPAEKVRLHCRIADIWGTQLRDDGRAIEAYRRALTLQPNSTVASEGLKAALERTGAWEPLVVLAQAELQREQDVARRAHKATEIGRLFEEKLGDPKRALAAYDVALAAVPLHRPALDARHRLLTSASSWKPLAESLIAEADASGDDFLKVQAALRAATLLTDHATAPEALDALQRVFASEPDHIGALVAMEGIHARKQDEAALAQIHGRIVGAVTDPRAALAALKELARIMEKNGQDTTPVQKRILLLVPDDRAALESLAAHADTAGDAPTQLSTHARLVAATSDPTLGAHHQIRIGEIRLSAGDSAGALAAFRTALDLDGRSLMAVRGLTLAARATGDPEAMRQAGRQERHVTRDTDTAVTLSLEAAGIHYAAGHEDRAASAYAEALELDPDSPEAATGLMATMMRTDLVPRLIELLTHAAYGAKDTSRTCVLHLCAAQLQADIRQDLPAGIAAVRRALAARPQHDHANSQLAKYLERNGQWTLAVESLEQALPKMGDASSIDAHLRLARIRERHLREPERAIESLRFVLEREPNHAGALTSLARLERLQGRNEEALALVRKLLTIVRDAQERAAALSEMAELEKGRGNWKAAADAALSATAIQGPRGSAAQLYRGLIDTAPQHASMDGYSNALMTYLEHPGAHGDLAAAYRELARVFGESAEGAERAIAVLHEGVRACPADASISLALVRALRGAGKEPGALSELRRLLNVDVIEVGAWRALAEVLQNLGDADGPSVALAPLVVLGQATTEEAQWVRARRARPAVAPAGTLSLRGLNQLLGSNSLNDKNASFVAALHEIVTKLEGIDYARWGINKRDRLRAGDPHQIRAYADSIAKIFGAPEFDLFIVDRPSLTRSWILCGSPPALLIPASVAASRDTVLAYQLARPLSLLARNLHPLEHVEDSLMDRMMVATVRQFEPGFIASPYMEEDDIEVQSRRVAKAIGFFSRGRIQEASSSFASGQPKDYGTWAREVRLLAARLGLLVADDLIAALEATGEQLGPENYATDLARFWISDPARRFRRAIGNPA